MSPYTHTVVLNRKHEVADRTLALFLQKPDGFTFKPGQFIDLNLEISDQTGGTQTQLHTLTLASAPYQDELVVATRMRDTEYKRALQQLSPGSLVTLEGPAGMLTLSAKNQRPAILIAGGIGVTPFISMIEQATHEGSHRLLTLIYSNYRPEDAPFLKELKALETRNRNFRLIATMTRMDPSKSHWDGETGRVDAKMISSALTNRPNPTFYLAGSPDMVGAMYTLLEDMGIDDSDIRDEGFYGY